MSTLLIALISGLVGAIATAVFSYIVQQRLAKKRREEEEARLAFVYLVKVSEILSVEAMILFLTHMFKGFFEKIIKPKLEEIYVENKELNMTHTYCALVANLIKDFAKDKIGSDAKLVMGAFLDSNKRQIEEFTISPTLLAQLPKEAIISYESLGGSIQNMRHTIKQWRQWIETKDDNLVTTEFIYNQWNGLNGLIENARKLRKALIKKGRVSQSEANNIRKEKRKELADQFEKMIFPKIELKPAEDAAKKILDEMIKKKNGETASEGSNQL
jgi:hypothetical protein